MAGGAMTVGESGEFAAQPVSSTVSSSHSGVRLVDLSLSIRRHLVNLILPAPVDIPPVPGTDDRDHEVSRRADDKEKFSALAFKLMTDPYVGQLTFVRVYSGVLKSGDQVYNPVRGKKERIGRILQMHANQREEIKEILAGDIAACVGLKDVTTGETLCDPEHIITLEKMVFPEPVIRQGVRPGREGHDRRRAEGLGRRRCREPEL